MKDELLGHKNDLVYKLFQKALSGIQSGCQKNCTLAKLYESSRNDYNQLDKLETNNFIVIYITITLLQPHLVGLPLLSQDEHFSP